MDAVFGPEHFRNEIIWKRTTAHSDTRQGATHFGRVHDVLLFYVKSEWSHLDWYRSHGQKYVDSHYQDTDAASGRKDGLWDITGPGELEGNPFYEFGVKRYWRYSRQRMAYMGAGRAE